MHIKRSNYTPISETPFHSLEDARVEIEPFEISKSSSPKSNYSVFLIGGIIATCVLFIFSTFFWISQPNLSTPSSGTLFDSQGRYLLRDFDKVKPMSSFLAGIGGLWGIPMWAFYVNRGQGISSFGIQNKDQAILKFNTAEKAYQQTPFIGFRTFLKGRRGTSSFNHMPFFPSALSPHDSERDMMIGMNEMEIVESTPELGLKTNILYFTIAEEDFPALVRQTTFTNTDPYQTLDLEVLDGLGRLVPSGLSNGNLDTMGRTMEAWMNVYNMGVGGSTEGGATQPFFHISQGTADTAEVQVIREGHFAISFIEGVEGDEEPRMLPFIVDPSVVFGTDTTLTDPSGFFASQSLSQLLTQPQGTTSRTPCAFSGTSLSLRPGQSVTVTSVYGHSDSLETFVGKHSPKIRAPGFVQSKRTLATKLVDDITSKVSTSTSSPLFDAYVKQDYLDNVLRGGLPLVLGGPESRKIYHTFSRIHGDIERDYNFFQLDLTYFSQGPGNFRDVNQNRRLDVLLTPQVEDFNVHMFLSFIQADGYNPLTVASTNFKVPSDRLSDLVNRVSRTQPEAFAGTLKAFLSRPFRPGQLFKDLQTAGAVLPEDKTSFISTVLSESIQEPAGQYAQNGFWADHWTYTLDLVENYLTVYPDKEETLLWDSRPVPFYMSPAIVRPRVDRYSLVDNPHNPGHKTVRVYSAVSAWGSPDFPPSREGALQNIYNSPSYISDPAGAGGVWQRDVSGREVSVSPLAKLFILGVLKFSTLDPFGMGVEMEGGKPGWNDAMNGLPGLVGSGLPETYEMLRVLEFVHSALNKHPRPLQIPSEFSIFLESLVSSLDTYDQESGSLSLEQAEFNLWDASNSARETYRAATVSTFSGQMTSLDASRLTSILSRMQAKAKKGIERAIQQSPNGLTPTYFYYECTSYEEISRSGAPSQVRAKSFVQHSLPLFLEGPARQLKIVPEIEKRREIYNQVRASSLYDAPLKMYTLCESLVSMGQEVGRMLAFSPGWLENESVWLHMSYKFYLELLRGGLYSEFFEEISTGLVPFMDPSVYGRSPLEASSFIVSSAFPDAKLHGSGFLARLSGSTAEFLSMWAIMMSGHQPFALDSAGQLTLSLRPVLPGWMFDEEGLVSFTFLGSVKVTYHNPKRADTWTLQPQSLVLTDKSGHSEDMGPVLPAVHAQRVRNGEIESIDLFF